MVAEQAYQTLVNWATNKGIQMRTSTDFGPDPGSFSKGYPPTENWAGIPPIVYLDPSLPKYKQNPWLAVYVLAHELGHYIQSKKATLNTITDTVEKDLNMPVGYLPREDEGNDRLMEKKVYFPTYFKEVQVPYEINAWDEGKRILRELGIPYPDRFYRQYAEQQWSTYMNPTQKKKPPYPKKKVPFRPDNTYVDEFVDKKQNVHYKPKTDEEIKELYKDLWKNKRFSQYSIKRLVPQGGIMKRLIKKSRFWDAKIINFESGQMYIEIYENPTRNEIETIIKESKADVIRMIITDDATVYAWDGYNLMHWDFIKIWGKRGISFHIDMNKKTIFTTDSSKYGVDDEECKQIMIKLKSYFESLGFLDEQFTLGEDGAVYYDLTEYYNFIQNEEQKTI